MNTNLPTPLRLYLIRRGETEWSLDRRHTGRTDIPLTQNGEDEARALGIHLRDIRFAFADSLDDRFPRSAVGCASHCFGR